MSIKLRMRLAARMLSQRKSYSATRAIALAAIIGVAIATAATVCVLSVFNGFQDVLTNNLNRLSPDIEISPAKGKVLHSDIDSLSDIVLRHDKVMDVTPVLCDNALVLYNTREMPVTLRGIPFEYLTRHTAIDSMIVAGDKLPSIISEMRTASPQAALLSVGTASQLSFYNPSEALLLFAPRREGRINMSNPAASFVTDSIFGAAVFESRQSEIDDNSIYCDINVARRLFNREGKASSLFVSVKDVAHVAHIANDIAVSLGDDYVVKDRLQQADLNFRMVKIEKWVSFLLLVFILIIASFNIISTLSMIVLDKNSSIRSLHSLGMSRHDIGNLFFWQSLYITLSGGIAGIMLGASLCLFQEKFGLIRIGGDSANMAITAYPVDLQPLDLIIVLIPIIIVGIIVGIISGRFAESRIKF